MADNTRDSIARQILAASATEPPRLATVINTVTPYVKPILHVFTFAVDYVLPIYVNAFKLGYRLYQTIGSDLYAAITGLGLCFAGGGYCASIAAIEAFRLSGWDTTRQALLEIYADAKAVYAAHVEDEKRDDNGDGVADVRQLTPQQLMNRKLAMCAMAVKDPERLMTAVGGLYTAWLAVQGVLRLEFAKTITLGLSIAEMATPALQKIGVPVLVHITPRPYHHWIGLAIKTSARAIGVALAWRLQVIVSAFHLAMRGGLLFSRSLLRWAQTKGYLSSWRESDTYADEVVGYAVASVGFYAQWNWGFGLPFPLSLLMWPFDGLEWYVRYTITSDGPIA